MLDTIGPEFTQLAKRFGQNLVSKLFQHSWPGVCVAN
jgi:hypothetical protein